MNKVEDEEEEEATVGKIYAPIVCFVCMCWDETCIQPSQPDVHTKEKCRHRNQKLWNEKANGRRAEQHQQREKKISNRNRSEKLRNDIPFVSFFYFLFISSLSGPCEFSVFSVVVVFKVLFFYFPLIPFVSFGIVVAVIVNILGASAATAAAAGIYYCYWMNGLNELLKCLVFVSFSR